MKVDNERLNNRDNKELPRFALSAAPRNCKEKVEFHNEMNESNFCLMVKLYHFLPPDIMERILSVIVGRFKSLPGARRLTVKGLYFIFMRGRLRSKRKILCPDVPTLKRNRN